jgi:hypothetical protein
MRWVTVNVVETDTLHEGAKLIAGREHRALKHIVESLRQRERVFRPDFRLRIWGAREVEPIQQADGSVRWRWHWHALVYTDGLPDDLLVDALKARWDGPHAVRVDDIRAKTDKQLWRSMARLASYPVKARYTVYSNRRREWLPDPVIDQLAQWRASRPSRWTRFAIGHSTRPLTGRVPECHT